MVKTVGHAEYSSAGDDGRRDVFGGDVDVVAPVDFVLIMFRIVDDVVASFCENSSSVWDVGGCCRGVGVDCSNVTASPTILPLGCLWSVHPRQLQCAAVGPQKPCEEQQGPFLLSLAPGSH